MEIPREESNGTEIPDKKFPEILAYQPGCPLHSSLKITGHSSQNRIINNFRGLEKREIT